jgi:hypothetical protein
MPAWLARGWLEETIPLVLWTTLRRDWCLYSEGGSAMNV